MGFVGWNRQAPSSSSKMRQEPEIDEDRDDGHVIQRGSYSSSLKSSEAQRLRRCWNDDRPFELPESIVSVNQTLSEESRKAREVDGLKTEAQLEKAVVNLMAQLDDFSIVLDRFQRQTKKPSQEMIVLPRQARHQRFGTSFFDYVGASFIVESAKAYLPSSLLPASRAEQLNIKLNMLKEVNTEKARNY
jgi:hypothetical protein